MHALRRENVNLGEVVTKPQYGWTAKADKERTGVKFLRTTDISSGSINWEKVPTCSAIPANLEKYLLKKGDILVARAGSVGVSAEIEDCPPSVFGSYLIRFRVIDPILTKYVSFFLKSPFFWSQVAECTSGITIPNINATKLQNIIIPMPPQEEQGRIVAKIESLFAETKTAIRDCNNILILLRKFRESVFIKAFRGGFVQPDSESLSTKRLDDLALLFNGKAVGSGTTNIRVFKTRHVYPNALKMENPSYLRLEQEDRIPVNTFLKDGDVLIVNTWQNLGRVSYVDKPADNWTVDTQIIIVRPKEGNVGKYIFHFLNSQKGYEVLLSRERGALTAGVSRKLTHIYPKDVASIQIPYLPPKQQRITVENLDLAFERASEVETYVKLSNNYIKEMERAILR